MALAVRCLTMNELAKVLTLSRGRVTQRHKDGTLPVEGIDVGGDVRFAPGPVAELLGIPVADLMANLAETVGQK